MILARLDAVPQTLSHFDFHPANIFPGNGATAVIDRAYCGCGPIGTDAGHLTLSPTSWFRPSRRRFS